MGRKWILLGIFILLSYNPGIAAEDLKFDTNVSNANLCTVLQGVALRAGKEIVINGKLEGSVTVHLIKRNAEETLNYLAQTSNFCYDITGNVITVSPSDFGTQTKTFQIRYADLDYVKKSLALFIQENKISLNGLDSSVTIDGTPIQLIKAQKELANIDIPQKQVYIKAKIVEISKTDAENLGFTYTTPSYTSTSTGINWAITSNAERTFAAGKILAQPSIATINGHQAKLSMGQTLPVFTTNVSNDGTKTTTVSYQDVGIYLDTTPRINDDGTVTCTIKPTIKAIEAWMTSNGNQAPKISTREAQTTARVKTGETIIIGGLIQDTEITNLANVPGISQIPVLGWLFQNRSVQKDQMEVFIFVTPEIVDDLGKIKDKSLDGHIDATEVVK